jgi:D-lactate dehydrogenase
MKICFVDHLFENPNDIVVKGCSIDIYCPVRDPALLVELARDADILCTRDQFMKYDRGVIDQLPKLKLIVTRSTGYDHIDWKHAASKGIPVCNVPGYGSNTVAEFAAGLMLSVSRKIPKAADRYHQNDFSIDGMEGVDLEGKTIGIAGTGSIGLKMARIAKGLGMHVCAYDIREDEKAAEQIGFVYVSFKDLLQKSDIVSLHLPLTEKTYRLINAQSLEQMKPGAILINTGRGELVDTEAMIAALREGRLFGVGLDVIEGERERVYDFGDLNAVVSTHIGWFTHEAVRRIVTIALDNILAFLRGAPVNVVNQDFLVQKGVSRGTP